MKKIIILCILALFLCACSKKEEAKGSSKTVDLGEMTADEQDLEEGSANDADDAGAQAQDDAAAPDDKKAARKKGGREARKGERPYRGRQPAEEEKPKAQEEENAEAAFDFSDDAKDDKKEEDKKENKEKDKYKEEDQYEDENRVGFSGCRKKGCGHKGRGLAFAEKSRYNNKRQFAYRISAAG